jgi:hypothetical protein
MRSACIAATVAWMDSGETCFWSSGYSATHTEQQSLRDSRREYRPRKISLAAEPAM